jgi:hypothetical protein
VRGRSAADVVLALLGAAALCLIVVELSLGAIDFGKAGLADPCTSKPHVSEGGIGGAIDSAIQRFGLSALNGAACSLHTTREELVLSFSPSTSTKDVHWDRKTIEQALRAGFDRAAHDVAGNGIIGNLLAFVLREALAEPIAFFLREVSK